MEKENSNNKNLRVILIIFILILVGVSFYIYRDVSPEDTSDNGDESATTTVNVGGLEVSSIGGAKLDIVPIDVSDREELPTLRRPVRVPNSWSPDAKEIITKKINDAISDLNKNPNDFSRWLDLAIFWKTIDDYEGAREVWEFLTTVAPSDAISFGNLGDLFGFYLKDSQKAEYYFLQAIEKSPAEAGLYYRTAEFYRDILGDKSKALAIVERGLKEIPNEASLVALRDNLK